MRISDWSSDVCSSDLVDEVTRAVAYAGGKGLRRMGAFAPNTPYGRLAVEALQASAARYGGTVERATLVPEQGSDMAGMAREFAGNTSYDAVLLPYSGPGLNEAVRHLRTAGLEPARTKLLGTAQWNQPSLSQEAQIGRAHV